MSSETSRASGFHAGCLNCGGQMHYDISSRLLTCTKCTAAEKLTRFDAANKAPTQELEVVEYACPQCGATVHTTQTNMVSYCSFCGSDVLFTERFTRARRPNWIVPFRVTREQCVKRYNDHIRAAKYAPDAALEAQRAEHFHPIYVPFYYYREEYAGRSGAMSTKREYTTEHIHTMKYEMDIDSTIVVKGELQCASSQFESEIADRLSLSTDQMIEFHPAYLCGFYAEAPDMDSNKEESRLEPWAETSLRAALFKENIDTFSALPEKTVDEAEIVLLPVWLLAEKDGGQVMYTAISGVDGRIVCDTPVDQKKTFRLGIKLAAIITVVLLLLQSVLIIRAKVVAGLCALVAAAGFYFINTIVTDAATHKKELLQQRESKKVKPVEGRSLSQQILLEARADNLVDVSQTLSSAMWNKAGALLGFTLLGLLLGALFAALPFPPIIIGIGFCVVQVFKNISALLGLRNAPGMRGTLKYWLVTHFLIIALLAIACTVFSYFAFEGNMNRFTAGLVSDQGWLPPCLCLASVVSLLLSYRNVSLDKTLHLLFYTEVALVFGVFLLMLFVSIQWIYYLLICAMMAPFIIAMERVIRQHNEHVGRPVPYFGRKEKQL